MESRVYSFELIVMRAYVLSCFRTYDNGTYRTDGADETVKKLYNGVKEFDNYGMMKICK